MLFGIRASDSGQAAGGCTGGACAKDVSEAESEGTAGASSNAFAASKGGSAAQAAIVQ